MRDNEPHVVRVGANEVFSLNLAKYKSDSSKERKSPSSRAGRTPLG